METYEKLCRRDSVFVIQLFAEMIWRIHGNKFNLTDKGIDGKCNALPISYIKTVSMLN